MTQRALPNRTSLLRFDLLRYARINWRLSIQPAAEAGGGGIRRWPVRQAGLYLRSRRGRLFVAPAGRLKDKILPTRPHAQVHGARRRAVDAAPDKQISLTDPD